MINENKTILILGNSGMLGRVVTSFFAKKTNFITLTAGRNASATYFLSVDTASKDFEKILEKSKVDYIINCIAETKSSNKKELEKINSKFPKLLSQIAEKNKIQVLHVSTDGVFGINMKNASEKTLPKPSNEYGRSKLEGEMKSAYWLNIRTSLIGFSPNKQNGLLEYANNAKKNIKGFINQLWTGATVLQLAEFLSWIIEKDMFKKLRNRTFVIHFAPLGPVNKYEILKEYVLVKKLPISVEKIKGPQIQRTLISTLSHELPKNIDSLHDALEKLVVFDKNISN